MKKSTIRLLVLALLAFVFVGLLASCDFGGKDDTYTVKLYDGETLLKELTFEKGATFAYTNADIAKAGYEVEGIYTDAAMTEEYKADDGSTPVVSSDLSLYVKFEPKQFYLFIDYNDNGVTEDLEQEVTYNATYTLAAPAERIGYRFIGFERKVNKVWQEFPATGTYTFTDDIEIRIRWEKIEYVTVLGPSGAEVGKFEIAADGSVILPNVADTADKYFGGYTVEGAAFGEKQQDGSYKATGLTSSVTALQKWTDIPTYTMTVVGLDGQSATYKVGDSYSLPAAPTRPGYFFTGYTASVQGFTAGGTYTWEEDITVTANWRRQATITVYNGTSIAETILVPENGAYALTTPSNTATHTFGGFKNGNADFAATGTYTGEADLTIMQVWNLIPTYTLTVNGLYGNDVMAPASYKTGATFTLPTAPERDGYIFTGYTVNGEALTLGQDGTVTFNWTEDTVVTATWRERVYITVRDERTNAVIGTVEVVDGAYDLSALEPAAGDRVVVDADKTYTYIGLKSGTEVFPATGTGYTGGSITVIRDWDGVDRIFISIVSKGAVYTFDSVEVVDGVYTLPASPSLSGYFFLGYYTDEACTEEFDAGSAVTADLTVYAKWRRQATITVYNGATVAETILVPENGAYALTTPSNTATHTFGGFKNGNAVFEPTGTYLGEADLTIMQVWNPIPTYTMTVVGLDGQNGTYKVGDSYALPEAPTRDGYFFIGYTANVQGFTASGTYTWEESITVTANWRRQITVSIYTSGGSFVTSVKTDENGDFILPKVDNTTDSYFRGYTVAGIELTPNQDGSYTGNYTGDSDLAAYQKWEAIPSFDIFFNAVGGAFADGEGGKLTVKETDGAITLPIPTLADYTFVGWLSAGQLIGTYENDVYTLSYSDWNKTDALTLTAKWEAARQTGEQKENGNSLNYFVEINNGKYTYILLTGHTYTFGTASSTVTLGTGGDAYVTNKVQNGFTVGTNVGAFSMTISDPAKGEVTIDVIVKNYISSIGHGSSTADVYGSGYLGNFRDYDKETNPKKPLSVGTANAFRPDLSFTTNGGASLSMSQLMGDVEYTLEIVGVTLAEGASPNKFVEITATKDGFLFTFDEILRDKEVILTILPKYALEFVPADKQVAPLTMRIVLNEGVNVHTNEELYAAFADTDIHEINVQRNITAAVNPAHGYNGDVTDPLNSEEHAVYYRSVSGADRITVNGNYFKIDASKIPLMEPCNKDKHGSTDRFSFAGDVPTGYLIANMQFGVFAYRNASDTGENSGEQFMTMNDLFISGNNIPFNDMDNPEGIYQPEGYDKEFIPLSGSVLGIVYRRTSGTLNNCIVKNTCLAYYATGSTELNPTKLWADVTLNKCVADQNWGNSMYAWGQVHYTLEDVYFGASGGPSIHFDDSATALEPYTKLDATDPTSYYGLNPTTLAVTSKLAISDTSEFNNYRTGTEAWFRAFGFNAVIPTIKPMFRPSYQDEEGNTQPGAVTAINAGREDALGINPNLGALPFTEITPSLIMKEVSNGQGQTDEVFNFIFVTKTAAGNFTAGTDNCDYFCKPYVQLTRISGGVETPIEPHAFANTVNAALGQNLLPIYACFDSKFYTEREIMAGMSIGFLVGLYE